MGGEVLNQLRGEAEAVSSLREEVREKLQGEVGSVRRGVLALEMALASSWLPGGIGGISMIGQGVRF